MTRFQKAISGEIIVRGLGMLLKIILDLPLLIIFLSEQEVTVKSLLLKCAELVDLQIRAKPDLIYSIV